MGYRRALSHPVWNVMQLFGMYVPWNVEMEFDKVMVECNVEGAVPVVTWVAFQMFPNVFCLFFIFYLFIYFLMGCAHAVCYAVLHWTAST